MGFFYLGPAATSQLSKAASQIAKLQTRNCNNNYKQVEILFFNLNVSLASLHINNIHAHTVTDILKHIIDGYMLLKANIPA